MYYNSNVSTPHGQSDTRARTAARVRATPTDSLDHAHRLHVRVRAHGRTRGAGGRLRRCTRFQPAREAQVMLGVFCLASLGANFAAVPHNGRVLLRSGYGAASGNNHDDAQVAVVSTLGEVADRIVISCALRHAIRSTIRERYMPPLETSAIIQIHD